MIASNRLVLALLLATGCGGAKAGMSTSATIPAGGGTVRLDGVAAVTFPPDAFSAPTLITITTTADAETAALFDDTTGIFGLAKRAAYEVRINTGSAGPTAPVQVSLTVPSGLGEPTRVLGQLPTSSDLDTLTEFDIIDTTVGAGVLTLSLEPGFVSGLFGADGTHEAILTLAQVAPEPADADPDLTGLSLGVQQPALDGDACPVKKVAPPLKTLTVTSPFDPERQIWTNPPNIPPVACTDKEMCAPTQGKIATDSDCRGGFCKNLYIGHLGVDYAAKVGDKLYSIGKGTVVKSYKSDSFGESVIIRINGVGAFQYAHMKTRAVQTGQSVECGQLIGETDTTGIVTGPHLHFELAPAGGGKKIDANPCIDKNACVSCGFNADFVGQATHTTTQAYSAGKNVSSIEATVTASNVRLSPLSDTSPTLIPVQGTVTFMKTEVVHTTPTITCTTTTTGTTQIVASTETGAGVLYCTALGKLMPEANLGDPNLYYYDGDFATLMHLTRTGDCGGSNGTSDTNESWVKVPSLFMGPPGYTTADFSDLSGSYDPPPNDPAGATEHYEWSFAPAQ